MHRARCAHNGVNRTRLNTFGAANAVGFVDDSKGTNGLLGLFIAVDRLGIDVQQGSYFKHDRFATRCAAVDLFALHAHRLSVRAAARVAALPALALR
ncbi:Uncharacterised protein [Enterobacter cloacae]|nr:Uncharacterised protein [Enterobacter cloacae]